MHTPAIFADLIIILLVSVPVAYLCLRVKLPLLVGLMLTGMVIGPYGLGLVGDVAGVEMLAEIGVMLLLFTIGLEFSLARRVAGHPNDCGGGRSVDAFRARNGAGDLFRVFGCHVEHGDCA